MAFSGATTRSIVTRVDGVTVKRRAELGLQGEYAEAGGEGAVVARIKGEVRNRDGQAIHQFTRDVTGAEAIAGMFGVLALMLGNFVLALFGVGGGEGMGLRRGGPLAIIFSLVCIGLAAFSFLIDFDAADQMIRAGAPEKAAWGVALGLTVTLVWLYVEILRLLSYFQSE